MTHNDRTTLAWADYLDHRARVADINGEHQKADAMRASARQIRDAFWASVK